MSHFAVMVVGSNVEAALAPFEEHAKEYIYPPRESGEELRAKYEERFDKTASFESWMRDEYDYRLNAETGKYMTTRNPRAKWDWWVVGGRWARILTTKDGVECNSARVGELDFEAMRVKRRANHAQWWAEELDERTRAFMLRLKEGETREQYIARADHFHTFAVLKGDEWFERGKMGWWATVSNEKAEGEWETEFSKLLASLSPDETITIVDCHI